MPTAPRSRANRVSSSNVENVVKAPSKPHAEEQPCRIPSAMDVAGPRFCYAWALPFRVR